MHGQGCAASPPRLIPLFLSPSKTPTGQIQHQLRRAKPVGTAAQISRCCATEPTVRENRIIAHLVIHSTALHPSLLPPPKFGIGSRACPSAVSSIHSVESHAVTVTTISTRQWPRPQPRFQGRWPAEEWDDETPLQNSGDRSHLVSSPHWSGAYYWQVGGAGPQAPITQSPSAMFP